MSPRKASPGHRRELPEDLRRALGRTLGFRPSLAFLCGSVNAGLMLSQALYWSTVTDDRELWFYKTAKEWSLELKLSAREQESARKLLREFPFWQEKRRGTNGKLHYRVAYDLLLQALRAESRFDRIVNEDSAKSESSFRRNHETGNYEKGSPYIEAKSTAVSTSESTTGITPTPLFREDGTIRAAAMDSELMQRFHLKFKSDLQTAAFRNKNLSDDYDRFFRDSWFLPGGEDLVYIDGVDRQGAVTGLEKYRRRLTETFFLITGRKVAFELRPRSEALKGSPARVGPPPGAPARG